MANRRLNLSREQLAKFLGKDHDAIKQFEELFTRADETTSTPASVDGGVLQAGNADAKAGIALDAIARIEQAISQLLALPGDSASNSIVTDYLDLRILAPEPNLEEGRSWWDVTGIQKTQLSGDVTNTLGETVFLYGLASADILRGELVIITGSDGATIEIAPSTTGLTSSIAIAGVAAQDIANGDYGRVIVHGVLGAFDASAWADGDVLYYNPAVAGELTNVRPVAPDVKTKVATVIDNGVAGSIYVSVSLGSSLSESLSDVEVTSPADNSFLVYNNANSRWEDYTPASSRTALGLGTMALENTGASGTFVTADPFTVTVVNGIITSIV